MNLRGPRERLNDKIGLGIWDYTNEEEETGKVYPIGYCMGWIEFSASNLKVKPDDLPVVKQELELRKKHKDKYHTHGHKDAKEAADCFRRYLIDNEISVGEYPPDAPCHECNLETCRMVFVCSWPYFRLCDKHSLGLFLEKNLVIDPVIWSSIT